MVKKRIVSALFAGALCVAPSIYGQAQQRDQDKPSQQADRASESTLTGCLSESAGAYTLATSSGDQVDVSGSTDLGKHKDHTVKLTGTVSETAGKKSLSVSKIEMVSSSCSK